MNSPAPGIRKHGRGYQACAKYRGERIYAAFPLDATLAEMQGWQADEVARMRLARPMVAAGTFAADVERYLALESVRKMPTYTQRAQHLREWVDIFGLTIRRRKITPLMVEAERDRWLRSYSASAVNHRLRALSNVWTRLDGRRAQNPVLDVAECEEPDPEARGLPYDVIEAILAEIPDTYTPKLNGAAKPRPSLTKARLRVIAYAGLSHSQLKALKREDVDLHAGTMHVTARRKGRKIQRARDRPLPQLLPLLPEAIAAFRTFDALNCWGTFSNSSMWKAFRRACDKLGLDGLRPYDFRHSFASMVYDSSRDLRATGVLLGHRSERTTRRYTLSTVAPHIAAAVALVRARMAPTLAPTLAPEASENAGIAQSFAEDAAGAKARQNRQHEAKSREIASISTDSARSSVG